MEYLCQRQLLTFQRSLQLHDGEQRVVPEYIRYTTVRKPTIRQLCVRFAVPSLAQPAWDTGELPAGTPAAPGVEDRLQMLLIVRIIMQQQVSHFSSLRSATTRSNPSPPRVRRLVRLPLTYILHCRLPAKCISTSRKKRNGSAAPAGDWATPNDSKKRINRPCRPWPIRR